MNPSSRLPGPKPRARSLKPRCLHRVPNLTRLPEMATLVGQRDGEERAEAPGEQRERRRSRPRPPQIEPISLPKTFVEPILPIHELAEDRSHRLARRGEQYSGSRKPEAGRRLGHSKKEPFEQRVSERARTGQTARTRVVYPRVDRRHERARRCIQVIEALGHRPALRAWRPRKLFLGQVRHKPRHLLANRQQLILIPFNRRVHTSYCPLFGVFARFVVQLGE